MILVINSGSSSIKFQVFNDQDKINPISILEGLAERITVDGALTIKYNGQKHQWNIAMPNHNVAIATVIDQLMALKVINNIDDISGVGFRVVHGNQLAQSAIITDEIFAVIKDAVKIAPLHNPGAISAIEAVKKIMPKTKLVACFDTAFHNSIPEENYIYPVPYSWYENYHVRKYGFHGISYAYITQKMSQILNKPSEQLNLIICHLGSGASMACVKNGKSFDTSMGFTPLAGLMMGTRSGDIDPSILAYMAKALNKDVFEITNILNKESGLLGVSQISSDMRDIQKSDSRLAKLSVDLFVKIVADFMIKYANYLEGKIDGIVFTAGVGENGADIRQAVMDRVKLLDFKFDHNLNIQPYDDYKIITTTDSKTAVYAIRTNEEKMIALDVIKLSN